MLTNINGYSLTSRISAYPANSMIDFSDESYQWAAAWGMYRVFRNERFHWITNNRLFGHKCSEAMLASVNGTIYKIAFRHHAQNEKDCMDFREAAYALLWSAMGVETDRQATAEARLAVWDSSEGNAILEATALDTQIILTSSVVKSFVPTGAFTGIAKTLRVAIGGFLSLWGHRAGGGQVRPVKQSAEDSSEDGSCSTTPAPKRYSLPVAFLGFIIGCVGLALQGGGPGQQRPQQMFGASQPQGQVVSPEQAFGQAPAAPQKQRPIPLSQLIGGQTPQQSQALPAPQAPPPKISSLYIRFDALVVQGGNGLCSYQITNCGQDWVTVNAISANGSPISTQIGKAIPPGSSLELEVPAIEKPLTVKLDTSEGEFSYDLIGR